MTNNGTFQIDNRSNKLKELERNVQNHSSLSLSTIYWGIENETVNDKIVELAPYRKGIVNQISRG